MKTYLWFGLVGLLAGCGGGDDGGGGSGPSPENLKCSVADTTGFSFAGDKGRIQVTANKEVQKIWYNDTLVVDSTAEDEKRDDGDVEGPDSEEQKKESPYSYEFELATYREDVGIKVASGSEEATCAGTIQFGGDEDEEEEFNSDHNGDYNLVLDVTSTAQSAGLKDVIYRCTAKNDPFNFYVERFDSRGILSQTGDAKCEFGRPESEQSEAALNPIEIHSAYATGEALEDALPSVSSFKLYRKDTDTTDDDFRISGMSINWNQSFGKYSDCHTLKVETKSISSSLVETMQVMTWKREQDPYNGNLFWKRLAGEATPKGRDLRGAAVQEFNVFMYCNWEAKPGNLILPSTFAYVEEGTQAVRPDWTFDAKMAADFAKESISKATYSEFRQFLNRHQFLESDQAAMLLTIRNGDGDVMLSNDEAIGAEASDDIWSDCKDKVSTSDTTPQVLAGADALSWQLKLCDFSGELSANAVVQESDYQLPESFQAVYKCVVQNNLETVSRLDSRTFYGDQNAACGYGFAADDPNAENMVPEGFQPGGSLDHQKLTLEYVFLEQSDENPQDFDMRFDVDDRYFGRGRECHTAIIEVPYKKDGQNLMASLKYEKRYNATLSDKFSVNFPYLRQPSGYIPTHGEIRAASADSLTMYYYCDWRSIDVNGAAPVAISE